MYAKSPTPVHSNAIPTLRTVFDFESFSSRCTRRAICPAVKHANAIAGPLVENSMISVSF